MARRRITRGAPPKLARSTRPRAARAVSEPKVERRARPPRVDGDDDNFLGTYFREMSELDVMSPAEELEAATRIVKRRHDYWKALLSYPPFVDAIAGFVATQIEPDRLPVAELQQMQRAARSVRDRETRATREEYLAAATALAEQLADVDVDGIVSDIIAADLNTLDAGQRGGLSLDVAPPREGSRPFAHYVQRVRSSSTALRAAKNHFVKANLRLVVSIARRFNHGRMALQDLIQEGNIGLMKAVDRFDYRRGFRFSTYGSWWIRHAISRAIADKGRAVRLPVHMIDAHHKVGKARRELEMRHGREATPEELAEQTGLAAAKIERMNSALLDTPVSLDRTISEEDGRRVVDMLEDPASELPGEALEADALNTEVRQIMAQLRPIEADILRKRFGLVNDRERTLKEIGDEYHLSRERVRQLQEQALGKMRRAMAKLESP
jgi:RNA polymerase primary sigma factor